MDVRRSVMVKDAGRGSRLPRWALLPVVGLLVLWGAAPALASGVARWRLNGVPITESAVVVKWKGTVKLTDTKAPVAGSVAAECQESGEGTVGTLAAGTVTSLTLSSCTNIKNCAGPRMEAVNLPWNVELAPVAGAAQMQLLNGGKGAPGIKLRCALLTETCSGTPTASAANSPGGVSVTFNTSEKLNCTEGGTASGLLEGSQSIEAASGKLSAEVEEQPVWLANGTQILAPNAVGWKGTLKLSDTVPAIGTVTVSCEDTGTGQAGAGASGELGKWTISNCTPSGACQSSASIEATGLPWHTELALVEGVVRDLYVGAPGARGYKLKCKTTGGEVITDECPWLPATTITNTENGVNLTYKKESRTCTQGTGAGAELSGSQAVSLSAGGLLHAS
jgi:hypothetical protein